MLYKKTGQNHLGIIKVVHMMCRSYFKPSEAIRSLTTVLLMFGKGLCKLLSKIVFLCSTEIIFAKRFNITWGVNDERIFIFRGHCTPSPKFSDAFFRIPHPFLSKCMLRMRKRRKSNLIRIILWWTKVSEAVFKRDWHKARSYLFVKVQKFRTLCNDL